MVAGLARVFVLGTPSAGATSKRLVVDFSLPGQAGTEASNKIIHDFGNGGIDLAVPGLGDGARQVRRSSDHQAEVAQAFQAAGKARPDLRVIDEATSGNKVFRTNDNRTAFALVFYPLPRNASFKLPTDPICGTPRRRRCRSAGPSA